MRVLAIQTEVSNLRLAIALILLGLAHQCMTVSADTWDIQIVDSDWDVGKYTSLALDDLGFPHISYYDITNGNLKYAYRDAEGWHVQTVDLLDYGGPSTSIALDAEGFPHIGYYGDEILKYAYQDVGGWHVDSIGPQGSGEGASLVLDPLGFAHISHDGIYSYQDSSGWNHEYIPGPCYAGYGNSLALDAEGEPHLTFVSESEWDYCMRYASKPEGNWQTGVADDEPTAGAGCSLLMDDSGVLHVTHVTVGLYWNVKYGWKDGSGWHSQIVDQIDWQMMAWYTSLVLDSEGNPHFCYKRDYNLAIQHWDGSSWHLETVDSDGNVGAYPSMALDVSDRPHISYYDDTHEALKYAGLLPSEIALAGELQGGQLCLTWSPVEGVEEYWVFGIAREPWFVPDLSPPTYVNRVAVVPGGTTTWSSPNGIGDPANNWTYVVIAMENTNIEITRSNRVGEHDFGTAIP
jgi:hypothetical protein